MKLLVTLGGRTTEGFLTLEDGTWTNHEMCTGEVKGFGYSNEAEFRRIGGLTELPDGSLLTTDHKNLIFFSLTNNTVKVTKEVMLQGEFENHIDIHDVKYKDGYVYVLFTGVNRLFRYDLQALLEGRGVASRELVFADYEDTWDKCHLNSFNFYKDDGIVFTRFCQKVHMKMRNEKHKGDLRIVRNGVVQSTLRTHLDQPHSVEILGDDIFFCESRASKIVTWPSGEEWTLRGYTRGLVVTDDQLICGLSINKWEKIRLLRSRIGFVDRKTNEITYNPRPKLTKATEIYDVKMIKP